MEHLTALSQQHCYTMLQYIFIASHFSVVLETYIQCVYASWYSQECSDITLCPFLLLHYIAMVFCKLHLIYFRLVVYNATCTVNMKFTLSYRVYYAAVHTSDSTGQPDLRDKPDKQSVQKMLSLAEARKIDLKVSHKFYHRTYTSVAGVVRIGDFQPTLGLSTFSQSAN